jgi:5-aminopentanamidase
MKSLRRFCSLGLAAFTATCAFAGNSFTVAGLKVMPVTGDKAANYAVFEKHARRAAAAGAKLFVTPEGYLDGCVGNPKLAPGMTPAKLQQAGERIDGPYVTKAAALAKELSMYIVFCFSEIRDGRAYISAALLAPDGTLAGRYSKSHLEGVGVEGGEFYTPGGELPVFDTALGRMGILICFDRQPPESARTLALKGAEFIVVPAYGKRSTPHDEDTLLSTRAYENALYIVYASPRNAFVVNTRGEILSQARSEVDGVMVGTVILDEAIGNNDPRLRRHPELYAPITAPVTKR